MIIIKPYSLKEIFYRNIDPEIAGLTANSTTKQLFSFKSPSATTPVFTRSITCWAKKINTSPQSIWNNHASTSFPFQAGGYGGSGTLISPRHIVYANHFQFTNGTTLVFVDMNNNCYTRTLSSSQQVGGTDIRIGLLNSDITEVSFARILDLDIASQTNIFFRLPALFMDQERNALIGEYYFSGTSAYCLNPSLTNDSPQRANFYEVPVGGDSGNPVCLIYNNEIIVAFTFFTAIFGPSLSYFLDDINSVMTSLGGGYTATSFGMKDIYANAEKGTLLTSKGNNGKIILSSE